MELSVTNQPTGQPMTYRSLEASQTGLALISDTQHMDVSLVTAEGDKVTLSLDARSAALGIISEALQINGHDDYDGQDNQGNLSYAKTELTVGLYQRDMTFTVEGDLNEAEMRDIGKVLKSLDKMMNKFVNGQMAAMAAQSEKLTGLDTIAGLEVNLSYESQVLVAQQSQVSTTYTQNGLPAADRTSPPAIVDDSSSSALDALAQDMAEQLESTATPALRMMAFVNQLMADYRQQAGRLHKKGPQMIDRVHHKLHNAVRKGHHSHHIE